MAETARQNRRVRRLLAGLTTGVLALVLSLTPLIAAPALVWADCPEDCEGVYVPEDPDDSETVIHWDQWVACGGQTADEGCG